MSTYKKGVNIRVDMDFCSDPIWFDEGELAFIGGYIDDLPVDESIKEMLSYYERVWNGVVTTSDNLYLDVARNATLWMGVVDLRNKAAKALQDALQENNVVYVFSESQRRDIPVDVFLAQGISLEAEVAALASQG
jgi:hypothetical protein